MLRHSAIKPASKLLLMRRGERERRGEERRGEERRGEERRGEERRGEERRGEERRGEERRGEERRGKVEGRDIGEGRGVKGGVEVDQERGEGRKVLPYWCTCSV